VLSCVVSGQTDPRKAIAALVQSSIDANLRGIRIERRLVTRTPVLAIRDDGEGVLPTVETKRALAQRPDRFPANERRLLGRWSIARAGA
jgi:hypothetical protein